ncbi:hypothetical protein BEP19_02490 [Ammoniphilus oxalaticus]|uniref:Uncharacterized protein n=1 Tax=Ammoniphilus oxalaticus TaxID=66863 RepID=A0A419SNI9_9BACL|nr:hypothetical protein [Ammoniphilus oxalaticus]RKD25823.1 hypothetical protein BEP19_02490 [Ammoniphilus oxalaticus]
MATNVWKDQFIAAGVDGFNEWKNRSIARQLDQIVNEKMASFDQQDHYFEEALTHMMRMRQFLSEPGAILGSEKAKHGEIAEHLEVNARNAWSVLNGEGEVATFEGVGRTAPEDFILDGVNYQSKFINGTNNTLKHVLDHFNKYEDTTMNYSIPKDQFEVISTIRAAHDPEQLHSRSIQAILEKVEEIEFRTGRSFEDVIKPSISTYDDVQLGKVGETVSRHESQLADENQKVLESIEQDAREKTKGIESKQGPSVGEGLKVAGAAVVVAAGLNTLTVIYRKVKAGKKLNQFDKEDWKDIGLSSAVVGAKGGVTAGSIYTLINITSLSAPFAGAVTSAAAGLSLLIFNLKRDKISTDDFVAQGQILCLEAGIAAIGGAIGQTLIPVPILGAILGTITANIVWGFAKDQLGHKEHQVQQTLNAYVFSVLETIESAYQEIIAKINDTYTRYNTLIEAAFDSNMNAAVLAAASIDLAVELGVDQKTILKDDDDLDAFFLE